ELVERERRGPQRVDPDVAALALAELAAARLGDQRHGEPEGAALAQAADQVAAVRDVSPLVAPAHLQPAAEAVEQLEEVVGLEQRVRELGERDSLVAALEPQLHGVAL